MLTGRLFFYIVTNLEKIHEHVVFIWFQRCNIDSCGLKSLLNSLKKKFFKLQTCYVCSRVMTLTGQHFFITAGPIL